MRQHCRLIDPRQTFCPSNRRHITKYFLSPTKGGTAANSCYFYKTPKHVHIYPTRHNHLLICSSPQSKHPFPANYKQKHNEGVLHFFPILPTSAGPPPPPTHPTPPVNVARCAFKFKFGLKTTLLDCAEIPITYRLGKSISINYIRRRPYLGPYRTELHQMLSAGHNRTR